MKADFLTAFPRRHGPSAGHTLKHSMGATRPPLDNRFLAASQHRQWNRLRLQIALQQLWAAFRRPFRRMFSRFQRKHRF
jgi:hypothetical protein